MATPPDNISGLDWTESTHIGDGVYARSDDRGHVWLRTDRGLIPHVIALDYQTLKGLARYLYQHFPDETTDIFGPPNSGT